MDGDVPQNLQAALADRFDLKRVLGRGGMATVYLGYDRRHRRDVAVKVLRPDLAASIGVDRFLSEIQIAARLNHPNILALHDSGEASGYLYYVMPYIDGASLRERLLADRRLDSGQALHVARPVADALSYAHRKGVLHRDIKPENILFSDGHPIVGDFGIAKAISTAGGANLTRTGFPLGTPGYMSPEQAAGLTDLSERSDVYSLAVVIYEMLVGETPGRWPSEESVRVGRFLEANAEHRLRLAGAGSTLEGALVRGLAVHENQRTASPAALMEELTGTAEPPRRRYSEGEVREIVKRASELEVGRPTAGGAMTMGGVEALAAEVGIDRNLVHAAAGSLTPGSQPLAPPAKVTRSKPWLGGPTEIFFERIVDGELSETEFPTMVDEIRRVMKNVGQVSQLGRSFSWVASRAGSAKRDLEVSVSVRAGKTRILIQESLGPLLGSVYGGIGGGMGGGGGGPIMGILVGAFHVPEMLIVAVPAWLALTFSTARTVYYYQSRIRTRKLGALAERLEIVARELISEQRPALRRPDAARLPGGG
jgi:serine/threonine protein kinase